MNRLKFLAPILIAVVVVCVIIVGIIGLQFCVMTDSREEQFYTEASMVEGFLIENVVIPGFAPQKEMQTPIYDAIKAFHFPRNEQGFIGNLCSWPNESLNVFVTHILEKIFSLRNIQKPEIFGWFIRKNLTVCTDNHVGGGVAVILPVWREFPYGHLTVGKTPVDGLISLFFEVNTLENNEWSLGGEHGRLGILHASSRDPKGAPQGDELEHADYHQTKREESKQCISGNTVIPGGIVVVILFVVALASILLQAWGGIRFLDGRHWSGGVIYCVGIGLLLVSVLGLLFGWGMTSN